MSNSLTPTQREYFAGHTMQIIMHGRMADGAVYVHRCEKLKLTRMSEYTRASKGKPACSKTTYQLDDVEQDFETLKQVAEFLGVR